ncbi:MAG: 23S rRNA (pseudouridine(1915)-N(3))-methyltransferase RlmH [Xylanivirga thermophila]|jgi:23S rRNA (pseudouridine1915-N3)-methyltransferase|uniref:23S rRNA (pseudouridine(1915)-N(3))-methyltransferase RlmH n=1 Tax=Xylanivirga thermophila TaxID=2496273 RepID=UPI00101B7526|nr:23S rRNA (pseudouridine(1915)-N(3))-methyltransferase RlmH [Xylanivirga thermophila]
MDIRIIAVGKVKEPYLKKGIEEYINRIRTYYNIEIIEVQDERAPEGISKHAQDIIKAKEGEKIMRFKRAGAFSIALAIEGQPFNSENFAERISNLGEKGVESIDFIIGGSLGLHDSIINGADMLLSFSSFTFPHQLMRLILLDQIYIAYEKGSKGHENKNNR